jgi:universal stress protein A
METYQNILVAVDFYEQCVEITNKAIALSQTYNAKLSIIHVVDNLPLLDSSYGVEAPFNNMDLITELMDNAKKSIADLADKLQIPKDQVFLEMGNPKTEIVRVAEENKVDLIVIGSHGRHGLALLLGSTANGVLHHARCDVLAVRLKAD